MSPVTETVHVTFGPSRADAVRAALQAQGGDARVIGLPGEFHYGPIDPPDSDRRQAWIRTVLRCDPAADMRADEAPWAEATAPGLDPVYWLCRSDAGDLACFLAFATRMRGRVFDLVDATGVPGFASLGAMRPADMVAAGLVARRRSLSPAEVDAAADAWLRLRREDAPLRVVADGHLVSAPLSHYDAVLVARAAAEWELAARLIGRTLRHLAADPASADPSASPVVLFGRILALGDAGDLDIRGNGPGSRDYEVRVPRWCSSSGDPGGPD